MLVRIRNLLARAVIGADSDERSSPQEIRINVEFEYSESAADAAAETDDLAHAVDYADMSRRIVEMVQASRFFLLEKLASEILDLVTADDRVQAATVEVVKPAAIPAAEAVSVVVSSGGK